MKRFQILLLIIFPIICFAVDNNLDQGKKLISEKEYYKGRTSLFKAINAPESSLSLKAEALKELAHFYENIVGQDEMALKLYKRIFKLKLAADAPEKIAAEAEIGRLNDLKLKYKDTDRALQKIIFNPNRNLEPFEREERITELQNVIDKYPAYYKLSSLYYYIGDEHLALKRYAKAEVAFSKAVELTPGMDFYLPVTEKIKHVVMTRKENLFNNTVIGLLISMIAIIAIAFYVSRPWRWITPRHLSLLFLVLILWTAFYYLSFYISGNLFQRPPNIAGEINSELPSFLNAIPGGSGSGIAHILFLYGTIGIIGCCIFAISTAKLKKRWLAIVLNTSLSLTFTFSILALFYLDECYKKSTYYVSDENPVGHIYFVLSDPEIFVLTNPKGYTNLNTINVENPALKEWIMEYTENTEQTEVPEEVIQTEKKDDSI